MGTNRGRSVTVFPNDIFVVSYPKSGNTWVRFLIANLVFKDEPITFSNIKNKIPDIYQYSDRKLFQIPPPRILKSHEYFDPRYKKVIYIVRDPRDIAVSYYYYCIKYNIIRQDFKMDLFIDKFINGEIDNFGSWKKNVGSWIGARKGDPDFLFLHYEDIIRATEENLKKMAIHLGINASIESINRAVELSSFEHMKNLEIKQFNEFRSAKNCKNNLHFVRKGQSGDWTEELSKKESKKIEKAWEGLMQILGYLP